MGFGRPLTATKYMKVLDFFFRILDCLFPEALRRLDILQRYFLKLENDQQRWRGARTSLIFFSPPNLMSVDCLFTSFKDDPCC